MTSDGFIDGSSTEAARSTFNSGVKAFLGVVPYDRHKVNIARRDVEDGGDTAFKLSIYLNLLHIRHGNKTLSQVTVLSRQHARR